MSVALLSLMAMRPLQHPAAAWRAPGGGSLSVPAGGCLRPGLGPASALPLGTVLWYLEVSRDPSAGSGWLPGRGRGQEGLFWGAVNVKLAGGPPKPPHYISVIECGPSQPGAGVGWGSCLGSQPLWAYGGCEHFTGGSLGSGRPGAGLRWARGCSLTRWRDWMEVGDVGMPCREELSVPNALDRPWSHVLLEVDDPLGEHGTDTRGDWAPQEASRCWL